MKEPTRWLDDPHIGSELKEWLRDLPTPTDLPETSLSALEHLLQVQAPPPVASTASASPSAGSFTLSGALAGKIGLVTAIGAGALWMGISASRGGHSQRPTTRTAVSTQVTVANGVSEKPKGADELQLNPKLAEHDRSQAPLPEETTDLVAGELSERPSEVPATPPIQSSARHLTQPSAKASPAAGPPPGKTTASGSKKQSAAANGIVAEASLLARAQAVTQSDPRGGLAMLREYDEKFPSRQLGYEAELLRIEALRAAGRHKEARETAKSHLQSYPEGPYVKRIEALFNPQPSQKTPAANGRPKL